MADAERRRGLTGGHRLRSMAAVAVASTLVLVGLAGWMLFEARQAAGDDVLGLRLRDLPESEETRRCVELRRRLGGHRHLDRHRSPVLVDEPGGLAPALPRLVGQLELPGPPAPLARVDRLHHPPGTPPAVQQREVLTDKGPQAPGSSEAPAEPTA